MDWPGGIESFSGCALCSAVDFYRPGGIQTCSGCALAVLWLCSGCALCFAVDLDWPGGIRSFSGCALCFAVDFYRLGGHLGFRWLCSVLTTVEHQRCGYLRECMIFPTSVTSHKVVVVVRERAARVATLD
jgi:hypothetical protein